MVHDSTVTNVRREGVSAENSIDPKAGPALEALRLWWNSAVDYEWLLRYHRTHPILKHTEALRGLYCVMYALLCAGVLATPGLVDGTPRRSIVLACAALSLVMSGVAFSRRIETKQASIAFIVGSDLGISVVLICLTPSPFAILGTALFTGIGNYAASFHGAKVFTAHSGLTFTVLSTLFATALAAGTSPPAELLTAAGAAFIVLFTSLVIMQALVSLLRQDAAGAYFDSLTGLRNRRGLLSALNDLDSETAVDEPVLWCIVIDLDGFKAINDGFGHDRGDDVLRRTASRIEAACSPSAVVARVGGEEFTVVGTGTEGDARACAERILASILDVSDDINVTASLGVSTTPLCCRPVDIEKVMPVLSARADVAMYDAKRQGGHRVVHAV